MTRHPAIWRQEWRRPRSPYLRAAALAAACLPAALFLLLATALRAEQAPYQIAKQAAPQQANVCQTFRVRPQDQIWLISTRHLGCPGGGKYQPALQVWRYENGLWQPASVVEFYATDSAEVVTPIYVHGNLIDSALAASYGLSFYFELVGKPRDSGEGDK